jgi:hypothetical protein
MKNLTVVSVDSSSITFSNGMRLFSDHEQDCCEHHYLSLSDLSLKDFEGLTFDLSNGSFFERIENYGIALRPTNGYPVRIPGYGYNNGYYSDALTLVITNTNGCGVFKEYDITHCQVVTD